MERKKNMIQYELNKIIKKTESTTTYLANKNFMSFKKIVQQIDLSKISEKEKAEIENEINVNSLFNSNFILKIEDFHKDNNQLNIIIDYFDGISLKKFLLNEQKKTRIFIKEEIIWKIFIQLCLGIYRIHLKNIIHRNINMSSVLLDAKYNLKILDFKKAYRLKSDNDLCSEEIELKNYLAPEIWKKEKYNTKSDVWSLGVLLYEMCSFIKPFDDENQEILKEKITYAKYASLGNKYSKELRSIIDEMLRIKPEDRISIKDIMHKYVFISRSKETSLFPYVDKIVNPQKKRILSSRNEKISKRPESGIRGNNIKKSVNVNRNNIKNNIDKDNKKKEDNKNIKNIKGENDVDKLTKDFFEVKKTIIDLIGKEKSANLFDEITDNNIDEIINKYCDKDINSQKSQNLKKLLNEYVDIMLKVIKNEI